MEAKLRTWSDPSSVSSFRGKNVFLRDKSIKSGKFEKILESKDSYTLHREPKQKFQRRRVVATTINSQWQCDLMDVKIFDPRENKNVKFILIAIDVVSRKMFAEPLLSKSAQNTLEAFKSIITKSKSSSYFIVWGSWNK